MTDKTTKRAVRKTRPSKAMTAAAAGAKPDGQAPSPEATTAQAAASDQDVPGATPHEGVGAGAGRGRAKRPTRAAKPAAVKAAATAAPTSRKAAGTRRTVGARSEAPPAPAARKARTPRRAPASPGAKPAASPAVAVSTTSPLSILIVASEAAPFARPGALADLIGGLPAALGALGHQVTLIVPRYAGETRGVPVDCFAVPMGSHVETAACYEVPIGPNARAILVEHPGFFEREHLYGDGQADYADNPRRFAFLCRAALEWAARAGEPVDVVHVHDWQAALVPVLLRTEWAGTPALAGATTVLTIHDAAFQGLCAPEWLGMLGLAPELYSVNGLEFWGRLSFLKGGIVFSDAVCTLGTAYARQLASGERASGLEGMLAMRGGTFFGVVDDEGAGAGSGLPAVPELARRFAEVFAAVRESRLASA